MTRENERKAEKPARLDWKDVLALIIAQLQVLLLPVAILLGAFFLVLALLMLLWARP